MKNEYHPDFVTSPGEILNEMLDELNISSAVFARCLNCPKETIDEIICGEALLSEDMASRLESVLGVPASFWNRLEKNYRESSSPKNSEDQKITEDDHVSTPYDGSLGYLTPHRVYVFDDEDHFIAKSEEEAEDCATKYWGDSWENLTGSPPRIRLVSPEKSISVHYGDGNIKIYSLTLSAAMWCLVFERYSPTMLATHNY